MIVDHRIAFCYQTVPAMKRLREVFTGPERSTAISIYQSMTEIANEQHRSGERVEFEVSRSKLAEYAGVSVRTLDAYMQRLCEAGLVYVERQESRQNGNLPSRYVLGARATVAPGGAQQVLSSAGAAIAGGAGATVAPQSKEESQEQRKEAPPVSPPWPVSIDKKPTRWEHGELAVEVLAAWNELAGTSLSSQDWLRQIIMRIREHPDLTLERHREVIERNLANPWWKGDPTPAVVYGNGRVFDSALTRSGKKIAETRSDRKSEAIRRLKEYGESDEGP